MKKIFKYLILLFIGISCIGLSACNASKTSIETSEEAIHNSFINENAIIGFNYENSGIYKEDGKIEVTNNVVIISLDNTEKFNKLTNKDNYKFNHLSGALDGNIYKEYDSNFSNNYADYLYNKISVEEIKVLNNSIIIENAQEELVRVLYKYCMKQNNIIAIDLYYNYF